MMKTLREYLEEQDTVVESDAPTNTTAGVAGKDTPMAINRTRIFGNTCVDVDDDTYNACSRGKKPHARWNRYVKDNPELEKELKKDFYKNKKLMIRSKTTGAMSFIK